MTAADGSNLSVPVLLNGWQFGCCADPPVLGAEVAWTLNWAPWYALIPTSLELSVGVERFGPQSTDLVVPALGRNGGLVVCVELSSPLPTSLVLTGALHEDHHVEIPQGFPRTFGVIERVQLVSWDREIGFDGVWHAVPGSDVLTEVRAAPKHLPHSDPPPGRARWRTVDDVLVDLRVPDHA